MIRILPALLLVSLPALVFGQGLAALDIVAGVYGTYRTNSVVVPSASGEVAKLNWSAGAHVNTRLTEHLHLRMGFRVLREGYKSPEYTEFRWGDQVNGNFAYDPTIPTMEPGPISKVQFAFNHTFIGMPLSLRHEFHQKAWAPFFEAGIMPSLYLRSSTRQVTDVGSSKRTYSVSSAYFNKFRLAGNVSFGVSYLMNAATRLFAQPTFTYFLTSSADGPVKEHLYGVGVDFGIRKTLNSTSLTE